MKYLFALLGLAASVSISTVALSAVEVKTTAFISTPIASNDFEAMGPTTYPINTPYAQGGITVDYISGSAGRIVTTTAATGLRAWYSPGNNGYTSITLTDGSSFDSIQFLAFSGWSAGPGTLDYDLRFHGVSVATGTAGSVPYVVPVVYGFAGGTFDEVRVQAQYGGVGFDPSAADALGLDNILIGRTPSGVPEPATWTLLICGFGLAGSALRRQFRVTQVSR